MGIFKIDADKLHWINGAADDPQDLCLHGHVRVQIGDVLLEDEGTVSAIALYLLKTLTEDKIMTEFDIQMIPCCGDTLVPNNDGTEVTIIGCPNGTDWSTIHEGEYVRLVLPSGYETVVSLDEYRQEVFRFVDKVRYFYRTCSPKQLTECTLEHDGYLAFWNEWNRRRGQKIVHGAVNRKGEAWYTDMRRVFQAIGGRQKNYNWLLTDCVCYPQNPKTAALLQADYCWLTGDELTKLVEEENFQWIWAVLSGFDKSVDLSDILRAELPIAQDYEWFFVAPLTMQHPLAKVEIVPLDSSMTLIFSEDADLVQMFREFYPDSEDMMDCVERD